MKRKQTLALTKKASPAVPHGTPTPPPASSVPSGGQPLGSFPEVVPERNQRPEDQEHQFLYPYGVGIDTHSQFIQVCVLYRSGAVVKRAEHTFKTLWPELLRAHAWALKVLAGIADAATLRYCIESTGTYHLPVLQAWRGIPTVVNPLLAGSTKRKTDVLDAQLLAHHSITGLWKTSFIPSASSQQLRVLWSQRQEHARTATRASNRINNLMLRFGHTIGASFGIRSAEAQDVLSELIEGKAVNLPCIAPGGLPESVRSVFALLLQSLQDSARDAKRAEKVARDFVYSLSWPTAGEPIKGEPLLELLQTVPGVGQTTALAWLSEVTDPRRFQSAKQVAAYCGCDPSLKVSAGKVTSYTRRQGNSRLHYALGNAAAGLLRSPREPLGLFGKSIAGRHKRGGWKKACGALARRIACGLWYVHSKAEPFSYEKYTFSQVPAVPDVPIQTILGKASARLLAAAGIPDSKALAKAYMNGQLAAIPGCGHTTIQKIREWIIALKEARPNLLEFSNYGTDTKAAEAATATRKKTVSMAELSAHFKNRPKHPDSSKSKILDDAAFHAWSGKQSK